MAISKELLDILLCPESRQRLTLAEPAVLENLNRRVGASQLRNKAGQVVEQHLDGALVREDQKLAYPIIDGLPIMLVDQAIELSQITGGGS